MKKVITIVIDSYLSDLVLFVTSNSSNILKFNREIEGVFKDISVIPFFSDHLTGTIVIFLNDKNEVERIYCYGSNILRDYVEKTFIDIKEGINKIFKGEANEKACNNSSR